LLILPDAADSGLAIADKAEMMAKPALDFVVILAFVEFCF